MRQSRLVPPPALGDITSLVDIDAGTVAGRAFTDDAIYELELERVFARAWSYLCDPDELRESGQFVSTFTGEDPVSIVRQSDGRVKALLNSCRHRGLPVCGLAGQAPQLTCGYHGWTYDLDGRLVGVIDGDEEFRRWAEERRLALVPVTRTVTNWVGCCLAHGTPCGNAAMPTPPPRRGGCAQTAAPKALSHDTNDPSRSMRTGRSWSKSWQAWPRLKVAPLLFPGFALLPERGLVTAVHPKGPNRTVVWVSTAPTTLGVTSNRCASQSKPDWNQRIPGLSS